MVHFYFSVVLLIEMLSLWIQIAHSGCPVETDYVHRIGQTRFYILQNLKRENCQRDNGDCLSFEQAKGECRKYGMGLAKIDDMYTLAYVGRPLEKLVEAAGLKDTWYWLDAAYQEYGDSGIYEWQDDGHNLKFNYFLYRAPRPTGVGGFVNWKGEYQPNSNVRQCLSLALPWPGKGDPHGKGMIYGHHTMFDERPCESRQKRHALCEASFRECRTIIDDPFILTDELPTEQYFYGDLIFGDRRYVLSWTHTTALGAKAYCARMGLKLFEPVGGDENGLIHLLKMWSREFTVSQFWTAYNWDFEKQTYLDHKNQSIPEIHHGKNNSNRSNLTYCMAMSVSYEFKGQLPCEDQTSPNCTWSFVDYIPANCGNNLAIICENKKKKSTDNMWDPSYFLDVDKALRETALTKEFGYEGNTKMLRSKYKQTFGSLYCPDGYRMLREKNGNFLPERNDSEYGYDYRETYWVVDDELFDKDLNSNCTVSKWPGDETDRSIRKVKCKEWHFYLCEQFSKNTSPAPGYTYPTPAKMIWKEGPQRRIYPLIIKPKGAPASGSGLAGRMDFATPQSNVVKSRLPPHTNGRFVNWILKSINKTQKGFTVLGRSDEYDDENSPPPKRIG